MVCGLPVLREVEDVCAGWHQANITGRNSTKNMRREQAIHWN